MDIVVPNVIIVSIGRVPHLQRRLVGDLSKLFPVKNIRISLTVEAILKGGLPEPVEEEDGLPVSSPVNSCSSCC
jgi:hypothetical protein